MAAIITDKFRRKCAAFFVEDITTGSSDYFVGIGKSDPWSDDSAPPAPAGTIAERREALRNLATLVKIDPEMAELVIPKISFRAGYKYKQYDTNDPSCFYPTVVGSVTTMPCYVVTSSAVYVCMRQGPGNASYAPSETTYSPVTSADSYIWVKAAELDVSSEFNTDQFVAIQNAEGVINTSFTEGMVYGFKIISGGSGYSSGTKPVCKLVGSDSQTDVALVVTVGVAGDITSVDFDSTTITNRTFPTGYTAASVDISGTYPGTGLKVVPIIAPVDGFGADSIGDLPTWYAAVGANVATDMGGDAYYIPYRQISVIREPEIDGAEAPVDDSSAVDALSYFIVDEATTVSHSAGAIIKQVSPLTGEDSVAFFDLFKRVEVTTGVFEGRIYYHQNLDGAVNMKNFKASGVISIEAAAGGGATNFTYTALGTPEYVKDTGDLLFLENRAPITRNSLQTEEIKIILQF